MNNTNRQTRPVTSRKTSLTTKLISGYVIFSILVAMFSTQLSKIFKISQDDFSTSSIQVLSQYGPYDNEIATYFLLMTIAFPLFTALFGRAFISEQGKPNNPSKEMIVFSLLFLAAMALMIVWIIYFLSLGYEFSGGTRAATIIRLMANSKFF